jgi:DMSO reductase anchor subunit
MARNIASDLFFLIAGMVTLALFVDFRATGFGRWALATALISVLLGLIGTSLWSLFGRISGRSGKGTG